MLSCHVCCMFMSALLSFVVVVAISVFDWSSFFGKVCIRK